MDKLKRHITFLLAFAFFSAQAGDTLHYLWVNHTFDITDYSGKNFVPETQNGHQCDHKLSKTPVFNTAFQPEKNKTDITRYKEAHFYYKEPLSKSSKDKPLQRGPPL